MAKHKSEATTCFHNDPANHVATPDKLRKGWLRIECKECGRFIGYRPIESKSQPAMYAGQPDESELIEGIEE